MNDDLDHRKIMQKHRHKAFELVKASADTKFNMYRAGLS
jgi:hypothetical protein